MTRTLRITPVLNGWIVKCGCQEVVFTDLEDMVSELRNYYRDPDKTEKRFTEKAVNKVVEPGPDRPYCPETVPLSTGLGGGIASTVPREAKDVF